MFCTSKSILTDQGTQYDCGDFVVRVGSTTTNSGLQARFSVAEVICPPVSVTFQIEYVPCQNLSEGEPLLKEFVSILFPPDRFAFSPVPYVPMQITARQAKSGSSFGVEHSAQQYASLIKQTNASAAPAPQSQSLARGVRMAAPLAQQLASPRTAAAAAAVVKIQPKGR